MIAWILVIILLLWLAGFLAFYYFRIYQPLQRLRELVSDLAQGRRGSGYVADGAAGIPRIIHDLEQVDRLLARLSRHVAADEFNLRGILTSMVEGVMVTNAENRIILANEEMVRLFHLSTTPVSRTIMESLRNTEVQKIVEAAMQKGERLREDIVLELFEGDARSRRILQMNASPLTEAGTRRGVVAVFHDITPIKQVEDVRREFVANVSHELRTPLSIFKGYLEMLLDNPSWLTPEAQRISHVLHRHSNRLNALVEDLLTLSRFESGAVTMNPQTIRVKEFMEQIVNDWKPQFDKKPCTLSLERVDPGSVLMADPMRIEQVFYNLLENALKYSRPNDHVEIGCSQEETILTFFVRDSGIGIPTEKIPQIFERFFRVDQARSRDMGGTGLGLTIVREIIRLHKGEVRAESEAGKGTTVFFTLPKVKEKEREREKVHSVA